MLTGIMHKCMHLLGKFILYHIDIKDIILTLLLPDKVLYYYPYPWINDDLRILSIT